MAFDRPQKRSLPKWLHGWCIYHGERATARAREIERREWERLKHERGWRYWHWLYHRLTFLAVWSVCYAWGTI